MGINKKVHIISLFISIAIISSFVVLYLKKIVFFLTTPLIKLSTIILLVMLIIVMERYIYFICKQLKNKKILKSVFLILIILVFIIGIVFIKDKVNYVLRNIILMLIYIIGVICLPIIILGMSLLCEKKLKKVGILISAFCVIFIYYVNSGIVFEFAKEIISNLYETEELFSLREEEKFDATYLENYKQKFARDGYISKWDTIQIIDISDNKSEEIIINYKDEEENINLVVSNKNDEQIENLKNLLKYDFYKFEYSLSDTVTINLDRYVVQRKQSEEKNNDIILSGNKNFDIIELKNKYCSENKESFIYENNVNTTTSNELENLKLLFVYDSSIDNYVPITSEENNLNNIINYKVYQSGIELTLPYETDLKKLDYTLRINRYDENIQIKENQGYAYHYEYEPLVTQMESSIGQVLEIKFDRSYTFEELKNIEIIF